MFNIVCAQYTYYDLAIGVDLGTTFSVVGINKNGKVIIIEDKHKHRIFPSVVSYLDNGGTFFYRTLCLLIAFQRYWLLMMLWHS